MQQITPKEWVINYGNEKYMLSVYPELRMVYQIAPLHGRNRVHEYHTSIKATVANIHFEVYADKDGKTIGAKLMETYIYPTGVGFTPSLEKQKTQYVRYRPVVQDAPPGNKNKGGRPRKHPQ